METKENNHEALCSHPSEVKKTAKVFGDTTEEICIIHESINNSEVLNDESFGDDDDLENFICDEIICDPYCKEELVQNRSNDVSHNVECMNGEELDSSCSSDVDVELITDNKFKEIDKNGVTDRVASTLEKNCTELSSTPKISPEPDLKLNSSKNSKLLSNLDGNSGLDNVQNLSNSRKTCSVNYEDCQIIYDKILDDLAPEYVSTSELPTKEQQTISEYVANTDDIKTVSVNPTVTEGSPRSPLNECEHSRNIDTDTDGARKFANSADADIGKVTSENSLKASTVGCYDVRHTGSCSNALDEVKLSKDMILSKMEEEEEEALEMGKGRFQSLVTTDGAGSTNENRYLNCCSKLASKIVEGAEENNSKAVEPPESDPVQSLEYNNYVVSSESECSISFSQRQSSDGVVDLDTKGCASFSDSEASENYSELGKSFSSSENYIDHKKPEVRELCNACPEAEKSSSYPECSDSFGNHKNISNCNVEKVEDCSDREKYSTGLSQLENDSGFVQSCAEDLGHTLNDLADSSIVKEKSCVSKLPGEKLDSLNISLSVHFKHDNSSLEPCALDKPDDYSSTLKEDKINTENIKGKGINVDKRSNEFESSHDSCNSNVDNYSDEHLQSSHSEESKELLSESHLKELPASKDATFHVASNEGLSDAMTGLEKNPISNCVEHIDTNSSSENDRKGHEKLSTLGTGQDHEVLLNTGEFDNHDSVQAVATEEYKITNCKYLEDKPEVPKFLEDTRVSDHLSYPKEQNDSKFITDEKSESFASCMSGKNICKTSHEKVKPPFELSEKDGGTSLSTSDKSENISTTADSNNSQVTKQYFISNTVDAVTENTELSDKREALESKVKQDSSVGSVSNANLLQQVEKRIRRSSSKLYLRMKQEVQELCCGHWFPNTKNFIRHLIENSKTETDSLHSAKLVDFGMQKCKNCSIWLNSARMKRHVKVEHEMLKTREELKCGSTNSVDPSSKTLPDSERVCLMPNESCQSRKGTKVTSEAKIHKPIILNIAQKPCPMSKKINSDSNALFDSITCNLTNDRMSAKSFVSIYSIEDLPSHFKPFVILKKLKRNVSKKQIHKKILKKSLNVHCDAFSGLKNKLVVRDKDSKSDAKETTNIKNASKAVPINCPKDEERTVEEGKENIVKKNKLNIKKISKPKVKVTNLSNLKPNICTIKHFTTKIDNELNQTLKEYCSSFASSGKEAPEPLESNLPLRRPRGRPKKSDGCIVDSSIIRSDPIGRIKFGSKKIRGRPIKRRRCGFHSSDSSDDCSSSSNSSISDSERDLSDNDYKENEENIPTVELDLFTVSPYEDAMSILLIDPQNPNFKIFASTDAIFVGDSALGDITNHMGYISDSNNVVYVDPSHFLFPKVGMHGNENQVLQSSEPIKYSFTLGKIKHSDVKLNKIKKKPNDLSKVSSESIATVPIRLGDDDKENKLVGSSIISKEANLDATRQKEETSFKMLKVGVSKEINLSLVQSVNNSKMVVIEKFGFDNPPASNLVHKEETQDSSNKVKDEILDSKEQVNNEETSFVPNITEESLCKEVATNSKEVKTKNISVVGINQDNDSKGISDAKKEAVNEENLPVAHIKESFDCKEPSDSDKQVNNKDISSASNAKQDHSDKDRKAFIYKTPQKSSIVIKKKESRVLIQSPQQSKVIVLKTSMKAEIEREKEAKKSLENLNSNISNLESDSSAAKSLMESLFTSSVLHPDKRVLKTISVNPIDINENSILDSGNYKLLANSQNPIIPNGIDCSGLDSIDVIDLTSLNSPPVPVPVTVKEEDPVEVQESATPNERISPTLTPKKEPDDEILLPGSPSSSQTGISSESNSIVTSTEINPFATLEDGVCLEEIIAESDLPILPKEEDNTTSSTATPCLDQKNVIPAIKEEKFDVESSIDDVNVESDSGESSLINSSCLENYPLADIIKGNNVWNTPLLFSPDKKYSITSDDFDDLTLSSLSSPKSKWSKCGKEKHQTVMTDYLQKVKNASVSSTGRKNVPPLLVDLKSEKDITSPLFSQGGSPSKKASPKSLNNSQINGPTKSQGFLAKMTPTKLEKHSPKKLTTKFKNKGQMLTNDAKKPEETSTANTVLGEQADSHKNSNASDTVERQSPNVSVRKSRKTPVKVEKMSKSSGTSPTKTTSNDKISAKISSKRAQPLFSPTKVKSPFLKSPKKEPFSEDFLPKHKNTLVLSPVDLINKTFNSKKDNERAELNKILNHSQAEIGLPMKNTTLSDKVYEVKVEDDIGRSVTDHIPIEERNQHSKTSGLKMRIILKDFPKLESSLSIGEERPSRTRKRKKKRFRKKRKLRKCFGEFGNSFKKIRTIDGNVINSLSSTTSSKEISPLTSCANEASSVSKYLGIKTHTETKDGEQRKDQSESDLKNETRKVKNKRKIVLKQFGSLGLPPRETVNNVSKSNLDESGTREFAAKESSVLKSSQKVSNECFSFPKGVKAELKSDEKVTQRKAKKKHRPTFQNLSIKSPNELIDERLWHSRNAKLKAQVMITDHQKGILNSSIVTMKSNKPNSEERNESVTTSLKVKEEPSQSQDIRFYFSKMGSPSENVPLSPSSPLFSKFSSNSSEKEKMQKSPHFNDSITPLKSSVSAPTKSPASQNGSSSNFKRKRKEKVENMDIRQFLSATETEELGIDSPAAKKQKVHLCSDSVSMEDVLDFEGFEQCLSCSDERSKLLQEYVDVLELNTLFNSSKFPLPVDQLCDWNEDQLTFILFEKG